MRDLENTLGKSLLPELLARELTDAAVLVFDRDLRFFSATGAALERASWRPEQIEGRLMADVLPADAIEVLAPLYEGALDGTLGSLDHRGVRSGQWFRVMAIPLHDDDGHVVGGVAVSWEHESTKAADSAARAAEARFDLIFDRSPVGMALLDIEGGCVRANGALCDLLGYTEEELVSRSFRDVAHPDEIGLSLGDATRLLRGDVDEYSNERRLLHASGGIVHAVERVGLARDGNGRPLHFVVALEDVSERRQMEYRLQELAERDGLTGLPNRPLFEQELAGQVARTRTQDEKGALLLLDLDHFKLVNDAHGHRVGDELLRRVAGAVRATSPRGAMVARLGGDELAVLVVGCGREEAATLGGRLVEAIRTVRVPVGSDVMHTTASVGIVAMDAKVGEAEALLVAADLAMYEAKAAGGDRATVHDPASRARERASTDMRMSQQLRSALERDALIVHAQPIVDALTGEPLLYELLVRLRNDAGEIMLPGEFLPHAERFGFIEAVDRWVAVRAVEQVREHGVALSINLSGRSLGDPSLPAFLEDTVRSAGVDPRKLVFEVTETAAIANMGHAQRLARRLRGLGCRFALDDFGAGFASFTYVKQIPFDFLKIDGSFVRDLASSREDRLLVGALVGVARGLGKETVAEYVCDREVLEQVCECGVDLAQGFHIGAPAPLECWLGS